MAVFNIFNWSHGVTVFRKKVQSFWLVLKQIIINPNIIAIIIGMIIFVFSLHLPSLVDQAVSYIGSANTPLSMIVVGSSLANAKFDRKSVAPPVIGSILLRNLIYPILTLFILLLFKISGVALSVSLLLAACPVASLGVLFTLQAHRDVSPAVSAMSLSTILSLVTIPLVFGIAQLIM